MTFYLDIWHAGSLKVISQSSQSQEENELSSCWHG